MVKQQNGTVSEWRGAGHYPGIAGYDDVESVLKVASLVWDPIGLTWIKATQAGGVGGGGDASAANQLLGNASLASIDGKLTHPLPVTDNGGSLTVDGVFFQGTQPVSLADLDARILGRVKLHDGVDVALISAAGALSVVPLEEIAGVGIGAAADAEAAANGSVIAILKRLRTLLSGGLPAALVGGRLDSNIGAWLGSTAPTVAQKTMANSVPVVIASDQSAIPVSGPVTSAQLYETDHDVANSLKNIQIAGNASPADVPPAAVSATGERVRAHFDRYGAIIVRRRKIRESYTASFRLAEAAVRLDQTFTQVANTNKQWATLHHLVGATKEVRLQYCICYITAFGTAASQGILELRELNTAPVTGNPAITPKPRRFGGGAAEAVCLYLPTTAGAEVAVNQPLKHFAFDSGIVAAASTLNPFVAFDRQLVLYNAADEDDEMLPPTLPLGTLCGWTVMLRTVGVPVVRMTVEMGFTEEIP